MVNPIEIHGYRDIVYRWEENPLITIGDLDFKCSDIRNAGVVLFKNETLLLITIEHLIGQQNIHLAHKISKDKYYVNPEPFLRPSNNKKYARHESRGVMDPRVTYIDGTYYITYLALGDHGYRLGLAKTKDFKTVQRIGIISQPDSKAGVLFPKKFKGSFARLETPHEGSSIWITYSNDLIYWGKSELIISPRTGYWDSDRIGAGPPPIEIDEGWLLIYYGAKETSAGPIYRIGAVILDKANPAKVIGRSNVSILAPREKYERIGDLPNIIFSIGAICKDKTNLHLFYGAADSCICGGSTTIQEVVALCMEGKEGY